MPNTIPNTPAVTDVLPHQQAQALVNLCVQVLPVWGRQLVSSRSQSETAVAEMLAAFAEIGPHLDMASRQSKQIMAALEQETKGSITQLAQACEQELQPVLAGLDASATAAVQRVIRMIQTSTHALEEIAKPFTHETQMVSLQVERMYKGFQYQDRISQMVSLLHDDIERLQATMTSPTGDLDAATWLAQLESRYVMTEQRQLHTEAPPGGVSAVDETTFF